MTNLEKFRSEEEARRSDYRQSTAISDSWVKTISGVIYHWDNFPVGQFSSEPFVQGANMEATNHPKGNFCRRQFPGGYCQGESIFGVIAREQQS